MGDSGERSEPYSDDAANGDREYAVDGASKGFYDDSSAARIKPVDLTRRDVLKLLGGTGVLKSAESYLSNVTNPAITPCYSSADVLPYDAGSNPYNAETDASEEVAWTLATLPDTQYYARDDVSYLKAQVEWILEQNERNKANVAFVTHEGDIVHNGSDREQWDRVDTALSPLDGKVPYSVLLGNHDLEIPGDKSSSAEFYKEYFGPERFDSRDWYEEPGPYDISHAQTFSAGGEEFLNLGLEWEPRDDTLDWANNIIDKNSDKSVIITTHSYLTDYFRDRGRIDTVRDKHPHSTSNHAEDVFQELVYPNEQVFTVFSGHVFKGLFDNEDGMFEHDEGEYNQVSENAAGEPVYEFLANFQGRENGGNGWMRLYRFTPDGGSCSAAPDRIDAHTYSPVLDEEQDSVASRFYIETDFDTLFNR